MAITLGIQKPTVNLTTSVLTITSNFSATGGDVINKAVVRITVPDGSHHYTSGNNSGTFLNPSTSATPDFVGTAPSTINIPLPLDINGAIQKGVYQIDINVEQTALVVGVISMTQHNFTYCDNIPLIDIEQYINCAEAEMTLQETTGYKYIINNVVPSISRVAVAQYNGSLADVPNLTLVWSGGTKTETSTGIVDSGIPLNFPNLYSGAYQYTVTNTVVYDFPQFILTDTITATKIFNVQCDKTACNLSCTLNCLIKQMEEARGVNPTLYKNLLDKNMLIGIYLDKLNQAYRCKNEVAKREALNYISAMIATNNCGCSEKSEKAYQIIPYKLCDCPPKFVEKPTLPTSTISTSGYTYLLGDMAYDSNYIYIYVSIGSWKRIQIENWT